MWTKIFDADMCAPGVLRHDVTRILDTHGIHEHRDDIMLLVSELVTNAVRHATEPMSASVEVTATAIRVAVDDASPETPKVLPPDPTRTGGNGMLIVSAVATEWGVNPTPSGKSVWFVVAR